MSWREHFGFEPGCEQAQPGHTRGLWLFYIVVGACFGALAWGIAR